MTRLGDKIPVEGLDEIRLARIERGLLAHLSTYPRTERPAPRWRALRWQVATAVCASALVIAVWLLRGATSGPAPARSPFQIGTGDSPTTVRIARAELRVASHSQLAVLEEPGDAVVITLDDGRVHCDVDKRPHRPTFVVRAADVDVTVVGTMFSVERHGSEVAVDVERGIVRVQRGGEAVSLTAGESWTTPGYVAEVADTSGSDGESDSGSDAAHGGADLRAHDGEGRSEEGSTGTASRRDGRAARRSRPARHDDGNAGARRARPAARPDQGAGAPRRQPDAKHSFAAYRPPPGLAPIMKAPPGSPADVERFYREQSIRTGDAALASSALYSLAYWQLFRLRHADAAVESAERYERRFRRGTHAESALWVRVSALCAADLSSRCRAAAHSYVRRYPGGRFSALAEAIVQDRR